MAKKAAITRVKTAKDIEFGKVGQRPLLLDMFLPQRPIASPVPAVIWIHGGGWRKADKCTYDWSYHLAQNGFPVFNPNYRLSWEASFPAAVEDCKCAVRWLRANATRYDIDPKRIGVRGNSAGGHLAMMVGYADGLEGEGGWGEFSSRVQAVGSCYGPSDLVSFYKDHRSAPNAREICSQFLNGSLSENPRTYRLASPVNHVKKGDPPLLMMHGELDPRVPIAQSELMLEACRQVGVEATLIRVKGAGHGLDRQFGDKPISPSVTETDQIMFRFFRKHLLKSG